jgi:hypothetical protein
MRTSMLKTQEFVLNTLQNEQQKLPDQTCVPPHPHLSFSSQLPPKIVSHASYTAWRLQRSPPPLPSPMTSMHLYMPIYIWKMETCNFETLLENSLWMWQYKQCLKLKFWSWILGYLILLFNMSSIYTRQPGQRGRYSDQLRAGRPRGQNSSPGRIKNFLFST